MIILILILLLLLKYDNEEEAIEMMNENIKNRLIESEELYRWNSREN